MAQLTAFKMPFEELRGKLATKQDGIIYSGQEEGARTDTLTAGKKSATNFSKYIVAYRRKGVNRFYIKSNTSINRTTLSVERQGALAFAQALADYILNQGGALLAIVENLCKAYNEKMGFNQSVRGFVIGQLAAQINNGSSQLLGYRLPDYRIPGLLTKYQITNHGISVNDNLFAMLNDQTVDIPFDTYIGNKYDIISNKSPYNTIRMYRDIAKMSTVVIDIQGVEYTCVAPVNPSTRQLRQGARFLNSVAYGKRESDEPAQMALFNVKNGKVLFDGKQFNLYVDGQYETAWNTSNAMPAKLYVNPAQE